MLRKNAPEIRFRLFASLLYGVNLLMLEIVSVVVCWFFWFWLIVAIKPRSSMLSLKKSLFCIFIFCLLLFISNILFKYILLKFAFKSAICVAELNSPLKFTSKFSLFRLTLLKLIISSFKAIVAPFVLKLLSLKLKVFLGTINSPLALNSSGVILRSSKSLLFSFALISKLIISISKAFSMFFVSL